MVFDRREHPARWVEVKWDASKSKPSPTSSHGDRNESGGLVRVKGSELAAANVTEVETLTLLGRGGYVGLNSSTLVSSFPKTGKTTLLKATALDWAADGHRVLIFTEEHRNTWEIRLQEEPECWTNVDFVFALGAGRDAILAEVIASSEEIVVIDTLRNCLVSRMKPTTLRLHERSLL
jgi:predicted ATP-dependent serine protease